MAMGHVSDLPINSVSSAFGSQVGQICIPTCYLPDFGILLPAATLADFWLIFVCARVINI